MKEEEFEIVEIGHPRIQWLWLFIHLPLTFGGFACVYQAFAEFLSNPRVHILSLPTGIITLVVAVLSFVKTFEAMGVIDSQLEGTVKTYRIDIPAYREWYREHAPNSVLFFKPGDVVIVRKRLAYDVAADGEWMVYAENPDGIQGWVPERFLFSLWR